MRGTENSASAHDMRQGSPIRATYMCPLTSLCSTALETLRPDARRRFTGCVISPAISEESEGHKSCASNELWQQGGGGKQGSGLITIRVNLAPAVN